MMLFRRRVSVSLGGVRLDSPPFDIHFLYRFDTDPEPNTAVIDIFNLSNDTINRFKKGSPVILNAGYEGDTGTLIAGDASIVRTFYETSSSGNERILRLEVGESTERWLSHTISKTYKPGSKASMIMADMLASFGLEIGALRLPEDKTYSNGRTFNGPLRNALRQIAEECGAKLHITGGAVFVQPLNQGNRIAFVLNSDTGLIDSPERVEDNNGIRWSVLSLLNYRIRPDSIIKIESRNTTGFFRVIKGEHICSDGDYETRMEVAPV